MAALEATNAELESHTATLGMSLEAAKEQEGYLRAQLGEATRRAEEEEGGLAELQSDVGKMKEERDRAREEARTKEGLIETMMGDAKELRESNRVLRGLNAELEEQVQEADDRIKTLEVRMPLCCVALSCCSGGCVVMQLMLLTSCGGRWRDGSVPRAPGRLLTVLVALPGVEGCQTCNP